MAIWGLGGLLFVSVLYTPRLVPRLLSVWGMVGYLVFISGTVLELFGYPVGVLFRCLAADLNSLLQRMANRQRFNSSAIASVAAKASPSMTAPGCKVRWMPPVMASHNRRHHADSRSATLSLNKVLRFLLPPCRQWAGYGLSEERRDSNNG